MSPFRRPAGIAAIAICFSAIALILVLPGIASLLHHATIDLGFYFQSAGRSFSLHPTRGPLTAFLLVTGAVFGILGTGLWQLWNWARVGTQVLMVVIVIAIVLLALPPPRPQMSDAEVGLGISAVCILIFWYLRRPAVKQRFIAR